MEVIESQLEGEMDGELNGVWVVFAKKAQFDLDINYKILHFTNLWQILKAVKIKYWTINFNVGLLEKHFWTFIKFFWGGK